MNNFVSKVKEEIGKILPPAIFFFVTLHIVALERSLMLKGTGILVLSSFAVTVAALTLGKAVLIVDAFPFVNRYPDRPLAYNVAWKTTIYVIAAALVHYLENLYDFWKETGGLVAGNQKLLADRLAAFLGDSAPARGNHLHVLHDARAHSCDRARQGAGDVLWTAEKCSAVTVTSGVVERPPAAAVDAPPLKLWR
jgi:hypothetical protein